MDSFYGGKQGVSFIIKETFSSVKEMADAFSGGATYTDVWYGEYCLIDTPNKNNADNGKIFRRGLNYMQADMHGAEYVGQIVGPSSGTPFFQINTIQEVKEKAGESLGEYDERKVPVKYTVDEDGNVIEYEIANYAGEDDLAILPFNIENASIVPGKYEDTSGNPLYNDDIKWTWCNIRKVNDESTDSWFYVGFEIPYHVTEYTVTAVDPYDDEGNVLDQPTSIEKVPIMGEDGTEEIHPFYSLWNIGVPKGIRGDCLRNLRVIEPDEDSKSHIYTFDGLFFENGKLNLEKSTPGYNGIDDDIAAGRQILVCDFCVFDNTIYPNLDNGGTIWLYLGDFNVIDSITLSDDGTLSIGYTHDDDDIYTDKLKWIIDSSLDEYGNFKITYNTPVRDEEGNPVKPEKNEAYEDKIIWIKEIDMLENGTVRAYYSDHGYKPEGQETAISHYKDFSYAIKWIESVTLDPDTGVFEVRFNTTPDNELGYTEQLDWVKDITIDEDGTIIIHHVNQNYVGSDEGKVTLTTALKNITNMGVTDDGKIILYYNNGDQVTVKDAEILDEDFKLKMVEKIGLNSSRNGVNGELTRAGLDSDKRVQVKYNISDQAEYIGDPLNCIEDMVIRNQDYHLLVLYSDPKHRYQFDEDHPLDGQGKDQYRRTWVPSTTVVGSDGTSLNEPYVYWRDYGTIKDYDGILVGMNVSPEDVTDAGFTSIIDYLNDRYPDGLVNKDTVRDPATGEIAEGIEGIKGKVVTYGNPQTSQKEFYGFNYNWKYMDVSESYKWYYLGMIADSGYRDAVLLTQDAYDDSDLSNLNVDGLAFKIIKQDGVLLDDLPKCWDPFYVKGV